MAYGIDKKCIMVVAAHPDDEVLGCGGTIARLSDEGHDVYVTIMGEGVTSRSHENGVHEKKEIELLHSSCHRAGELIGAKDLFLLNLPDNCFDTLPLLEIVKKIENVFYRIKPNIIFTHHGGDLNIDHVIAHRATMTATRPIENCTVEDFYAFEIASSTEWSFQQFHPIFRPNVFFNIRETLDKKIEAMMCYASEVRSFPHPRSAEALRTNANRWGSVVGGECAEAFELIRSLK
jgi:LmbE family N-acetylglucosaminyl deacetylase